MTEKKKAWDWASKYIRLRDALDFCKRMRIDISEMQLKDIPVRCCTCPKILPWFRMDAGHYYGRGVGGGSGAYFDERNINTQCKVCNGFRGGRPDIYKEFMLYKWGQEVIDELEILHLAGRQYQDGELIAIGQLYKEMFEKLKGL